MTGAGYLPHTFTMTPPEPEPLLAINLKDVVLVQAGDPVYRIAIAGVAHPVLP